MTPPRRRSATRARWRAQPVSLLAAAVVVGSITTLVFDTREARTEAAVVTEQRNLAAEQALNLAGQIQLACRSSELSGPVCQTAAQVAANPIPGPAGAPGAPGAAGVDGADGVDGQGVTGTSIVDDQLIVSYSDGTREDVGTVAGRDGVGIAATTIEDGRLVVLYSNGRQVDVGTVVGAPGSAGRGVDGVAAQDGRLVVTYSDGDVVDAGPLPVGPAGADSSVPGPPGEPGPTGPAGPPGPACPTGTELQQVLFGVDGPAGVACVFTEETG